MKLLLLPITTQHNILYQILHRIILCITTTDYRIVTFRSLKIIIVLKSAFARIIM